MRSGYVLLADRLLVEGETMAQRVAKVAEQCTQRLAGDIPDAATKIVSMHGPDARAIREGRIGKPVELGYKAQVVDNDHGSSSTSVLKQALQGGWSPRLSARVWASARTQIGGAAHTGGPAGARR